MPKLTTPSSKHMITSCGVKILKGSHQYIKGLKAQGYQPAIYGHRIWQSGFVLMNYLKKHPLPKRTKVMELGCGWGITSVFLAKQYHASVTAVDADKHVAAYLALHAYLNQVQVEFKRNRFEKISTKQLKGQHTLVGSDICFWESMDDTLYNLIRRALKANVQQIIIADPGRSPFWRLSERCQTKLNAKMVSHRINKPTPTEKYLLVINQ
ncbi:class I SAM-dependent methyltransferase [Spartinivicinus poritis]|uniref:Methyltransferase domain-containing protein n=1 Tax=Spartinivicinus poritis TaxID=2994640 RepID=A0ABT5UGN9_9GAMM|nr:methyltransferase domain-containing protein [Spartinivicinus sp. A2-2]MDE1465545.1 methyltransferase domain-containing protein [Spartinivicinus sp. A2-2]